MTQAPSPTDNRLAKGQRTRDSLLEAGLRLFAVKGLHGAGTRELARAAGANIAAIAFHFGGKEGLYRAVIASVADELSRIHRAALAETGPDAGADAGPGTAEEARQRARRVVGALTLGLLASNRSQWMSLLLQREFIAPTEAFETIYAQAIAPTLDALAELAATATGREPGSLDSQVLAFSLFIVASAFARNRNTFRRFSGLPDYTPEAMAAIGRAVAEFAEHGLGGRP